MLWLYMHVYAMHLCAQAQTRINLIKLLDYMYMVSEKSDPTSTMHVHIVSACTYMYVHVHIVSTYIYVHVHVSV